MEQMKKLGFLGYGNMASAIAEGLVKQGLIESANVYAYDPAAERSAAATKNGFVVCASAQALAAAVDTLVLAVKPQMMDSALQDLAPGLSQDTRVISIAAGISIDFIQKHLDPAQHILRVMPNTPALAQAGAAAIAPSAQCTADDTAVTKAIFEAVGIAEIVEEKDIDAVTGLSGSGPAYFFYMVECMVKAGVKEGLDADTATRLAGQTLLGAGKLLQSSSDSAATLREKVTSKGGTTAAALAQFRADDFADVIQRAVHAATERSKELGA